MDDVDPSADVVAQLSLCSSLRPSSTLTLLQTATPLEVVNDLTGAQETAFHWGSASRLPADLWGLRSLVGVAQENNLQHGPFLGCF